MRILIAIKKLDVEIVFLDYNDEETPKKMIGKKLLPILEYEEGKYVNESLDICHWLDKNVDSPFSLDPHSYDENLRDILEILESQAFFIWA